MKRTIAVDACAASSGVAAPAQDQARTTIVVGKTMDTLDSLMGRKLQSGAL